MAERHVGRLRHRVRDRPVAGGMNRARLSAQIEASSSASSVEAAVVNTAIQPESRSSAWEVGRGKNTLKPVGDFLGWQRTGPPGVRRGQDERPRHLAMPTVELQRNRAAPGQAEHVRAVHADHAQPVRQTIGVVRHAPHIGRLRGLTAPGASHTITVNSSARPSCCHLHERLSSKPPCRRTSGGPPPTWRYAIRWSPT